MNRKKDDTRYKKKQEGQNGTRNTQKGKAKQTAWKTEAIRENTNRWSMKKRFLGKHTKVSIDNNIVYIYIHMYLQYRCCRCYRSRTSLTKRFNRTKNAMVSVTQSIKGVLLHPAVTSWSMWGWKKIGQMGDFWEGWLRHATQRTANCYTFASGIVFSSKLLMLPSMS